MYRLYYWLRDPRILSLIGITFVAAAAVLSTQVAKVAMTWAAVIVSGLLLTWIAYWVVKKIRARRKSAQIGALFTDEADKAMRRASHDKRAEIALLRDRMVEAVATIKTSKLGDRSGRAALYELPWYIVIGNPAAGKSSAIVSSGLQFPFSGNGNSIIQGIGGTRNCDWFFTTEGIFLDTAGRYSVEDEDRTEWLGFLSLLKKQRPKAPINGIVIAASIAELTQNKPEYSIQLAKQLRQRVHELTELLEVQAPVYILFTKADLISGFVEFFEDADVDERTKVWGATLPYAGTQVNAVAQFDEHFEHLYEGLKQMSTARMALNGGEAMAPGLLTFPLEFATIKPALRNFVVTLFEDNPFQFSPIFRGFYFTSALQQGAANSVSSERIAEQFCLQLNRNPRARVESSQGFFLKNLFSRVIFADRNLVKQYTSRRKLRLRYLGFFGAAAVLGALLAAWSWSYIGNKKLVANVEVDLAKVAKLQESRLDLASRLEALEILQDRLDQLQRYQAERPASLGLGLYQGDVLERKLRREYFSGIREILLKPVVSNLESFLSDVNANSDRLQPMGHAPKPVSAQVGGGRITSVNPSAYKDVSPTDAEDAYNALKTYLMLGSRDHIDSSHLSDQLTRFWRSWLENNRGTMPREQLIRSAERIVSFFAAQASSPDFPQIDTRLALVDQTRDTLRRVVKGMPARERVYAEIKMRAATRFPAMTVARIVGEEDKQVIVGSYAIPGAFTRAAWEQYVDGAIKNAANKDLQSTDWVLKMASRDDLTLEGSPEQIQKALVAMYKTEYVREWQKFIQDVGVTKFDTFDVAVARMNRLGDPANSPLRKLMETLYQETSWDGAAVTRPAFSEAQRGISEWFKETILRQPAPRATTGSAPRAISTQGAISREFSAIAALAGTRGEKDTSLLQGYLGMLAKLRSRFNQINTAGDAGPAVKQLVQQTLEGSGSELAEALKYVDENMLNGVSDVSKATVRPLLVRPLIQGFAVLLPPTEREINRTWDAQVYAPFSSSLATKYPFASDSRVEATSGEIGQIFGPDGAIAKFVQGSLGSLVVRRGDALTSKTWADMGISLAPEFTANFARYVAPVGAASVAAAEPQTVFQIQPVPTPGLTEYSIEIDGQVLRYRNGAQDWSNFVWPNSQGQPGVKISGVTFDGRTVEVFSNPGRFGLERMISAAQRRKKDDGTFELTWSAGNAAVTVNFKIISSPQVDGAGNAAQAKGLRNLRLPAVIAGGAR